MLHRKAEFVKFAYIQALVFLYAVHCEEYPCPDGQFLNTLKYVCEKCKVCLPGEYVSRPCNSVDDAECVRCPNGTFSAKPNLRQCRNCTTCKVTSYIYLCNSTSDAVCLLEEPEKSSKQDVFSLALGLIITIISVVVLACAIIYSVRRRRRRNCEASTQGETEMMAIPEPGPEEDAGA
ncbi:tumor necrosis factor receptor superfamily member 26-like isoform X1 [Rhopilema esculentum]|uniref:tumor necrosis factor receptor superfamily member 26-like isoform X1 n=1 Tax=Rhopilema esculentum TaxID=499914 RepID=UPI0031DC88BB